MTLDNKLWQRWNKDWNAIISVAQSRNWFVKPLLVKPAVDLWDIVSMEERLGFQYPNEFKYVLTNYAGGVHFFWQMKQERAPAEFKDVSGANHYLWDFDLLKNYDYWLTNNSCLDINSPMYDKTVIQTAPFLHTHNGDEIAFDVSKGLYNCPVVYLNHEDEGLHGAKLADNFVEFITIWSNIGCPGGEHWQLQPFYNIAEQKLTANSEIIYRWKKWLNMK